MKRALMLGAVLAAFVAGPAMAGDAEAGKAKAAQVCAACHGAEGNKPTGPDFPILAGQYKDYIRQALSDYKSGKRKNPIMKGFAETLSVKDMDDVAEWFSVQPSPLITHR